MTAVDVVPVSEWLSLGAQRPVVRCPGTGAGGRRCLVRLLVCGVESGVVRPVWRALEHVPGCDRARAWGDGPGAAGWWCIEGPDAGRGVGVMPEGVCAVVEGLEVSGLPEGVTCAQTTVVRWGLEWGLDGGEVAWRVGSESCPPRMPSVRSWVRRGDVTWGGWRPAVRCASGLPAWLGRWALTWRGCRWWLMPGAARVSWLSGRRRGGRSGCWCRAPTGRWRRAWGGSPGSRGWTTPRWLTWSGACRELVRADRRCGWYRPGRCRGCQFSGRRAGCR